jgi:hypothetical protein
MRESRKELQTANVSDNCSNNPNCPHSANCPLKKLEEFLKNSKNMGGVFYYNPESRLVRKRDLSILAERLENIEAQLKTLIETKNDQ